MIESPSFTLSVYGVGTKYGFLPHSVPLSRLPNQYYNPWEELIAVLPSEIAAGSFRSRVGDLPVLDVDRLTDETQWRRAYVILSFFTHAYIWGGETPSQRLPSSIAVPFLDVADHLALPATATYAGLNLWNWAPSQPGVDITLPENVRMLHTFTGTPDEAWFYLISVSIEAQGAAILPTVLECFESIRVQNDLMTMQCLHKIAAAITSIGLILDRMHEGCDPGIFYHRIRPFLAGSKGMTVAGLPNGVFYDEGDGSGQWRQYSGGSNAQSSLIQLLDLALGVEHYSTGSSSINGMCKAIGAKQGYLNEMRKYMPGSHRHFLSYVSNVANIRRCVEQEACDLGIRRAYQSAIASLTLFRDKHIRIVSRYIITPSKQSLAATSDKPVNLATASSAQSRGAASKGLSGTGGTTLIPFLKQTRNETRDAGQFCLQLA